jgi:hypothetical protein
VRLDHYKENNGDGLEIYDNESARYLTVTGALYPPVGLRPIRSNQEALEAFTVKYGTLKAGEDEGEALPDTAGLPVVARSVEEILKFLATRNKRGAITKLVNGDTSDYPGASEADAALAYEITYYTRDAAVIEEVMRTTALLRDKWATRRGRSTYIQVTIGKALKMQGGNYDADQLKGAAQKKGVVAALSKLAAKGAEVLIGGIADLLTPKGVLRSDVWAVSELLRRHKDLLGVCYFDTFSALETITRSLKDAMRDGSAPEAVGRVTDQHLLAVRCWLAREWGLNIRPDEVPYIVARWAQATSRNPLAERLNALGDAWDKKPRLDDWLIRYCKAQTVTTDGRDIGAYVMAVGSRWLISMVARAMKPGVKADCMLVLEGAQGARKSSAVRTLAEAIGPEYFREGFSVTGGRSKEDQIALRGKLLVEWGELAGNSRRDANETKNFVSQITDSYRSIYGKNEQDWPRTAVFAATTNEQGYLRDATGNRRFWPVSVGRADIDALRRDAAQVWGEAVSRWRMGERWWFDPDDVRDVKLLAMSDREQRARLGSGYWDEFAADLAEHLVEGTLVDDQSGVFAADAGNFSVEQMRVWLARLVKGDARFDDASWMKATEGLKRAGWVSVTIGGRKRWKLTPDRRNELRLLRDDGVVSMTSMRSIKLANQAEATAKMAMDAARVSAASGAGA